MTRSSSFSRKMSSSVVLLLLVAVFVAGGVLPPPPSASAADVVVGGDAGWTPLFNYTAWAAGMKFRVGDKLIFKYKEGAHNVAIVGGAEFRACNSSAASDVLGSGDDVLLLQATGMKWYISGVGDDCIKGQRLAIEVLPAADPPSPSPSPSSPPPPGSPPPPPSSPPPTGSPPPSSPSPPSTPAPPPPPPNSSVPPPAPAPPSPPSSSWTIPANIYAAAMAAAVAAMFVA